MYKKFFLLSIIVLSFDLAASCSNECIKCAHSVFIPRLLSNNSMLELGLCQYDLQGYFPKEHLECCPWITIQGMAFYFQSTNSTQITESFFPQCQESLFVQQNNTSSVSSPWLKIARPSDSLFSSTYYLEPKRVVGGAALKLFFDLKQIQDCSDSCWYQNWWASIFIPIMAATQKLMPEELLINGQGTAANDFGTVTTAMNNPQWCFGKLPCKSHSKAGVDDINIKLGLNFIENCRGHLGLYGIVFAPTGSGTKARQFFEPLVGGNHVGLGLGINTDYNFYSNEVSTLDLMVDIRYAYFFNHNEVRSMDLFNGDWSRYMLFAMPSDPNIPLPGINFLTQEVGITPRGTLDAWIALHYFNDNWDFEFGLDFWWRQQEKISLIRQCPSVGIFDILGNPKTTASTAKICQAVAGVDAPVSDTTFTPIRCNYNQMHNDCCIDECVKSSVINPDSGSAREANSITFYLGAGHHFLVGCESPVMVGLGGSYEFGQTHTALSQFGLWLKASVGF